MAKITIPIKNTGDNLTAAEWEELMDAVRDGTVDIDTSTVLTSGTQIDTDDVLEGTNLYYTDARVQAVSINEVVEDTTPQLGGALDAQSNDITSVGNLGVGQATPGAEIHVTNDQAALTAIRIDNTDASGSMALNLYDGSNKRAQVLYDTAAALMTVGTDFASGQLSFNTNTDVEAARFQADGTLLMSANINVNGSDLRNIQLAEFDPPSQILATGGGTTTIDFTTGNNQEVNMGSTSSTTFAFTDPSGDARVQIKVIYGSGSNSITWPAAVQWPDGTTPTETGTDGAVDIFTFWFDASAAAYYGVASQNFS